MSSPHYNQPDHPENDLSDAADYANLMPPDPQTPEELAAAMDPAERARLNEESSRQAWQYLGWSLLAMVVVAVVLLFVARFSGGELCDAGEATWLCSPASQVWYPIAASIVPPLALIGCGVLLMRKLRSYVRWRTWMGVFWILIVVNLIWLTSAAGYLAV